MIRRYRVLSDDGTLDKVFWTPQGAYAAARAHAEALDLPGDQGPGYSVRQYDLIDLPVLLLSALVGILGGLLWVCLWP